MSTIDQDVLTEGRGAPFCLSEIPVKGDSFSPEVTETGDTERKPMESFAFWLDRPFDTRRASGPRGRRVRYVVLRYRGSLRRSAVKVLVVFALLATMSNVIGDRAGQDLEANDIPYAAGTTTARR
jgi:hypothetical protein